MIPIEYEDYELSAAGLAKAKQAYYNYAVMEYIKAHGEVDQPVEYFENIPVDFIESFRQREYAEYYRRNYIDLSRIPFYIENIDTATGIVVFENLSGKDIEYSSDEVNWNSLSIPMDMGATLNVEPGTKLYLRGTNSAFGSNTQEKHISANFNHNLGGNICSLLNKTNFSTMTSITGNYAFGNLFYQDAKLISAAFTLGNATSLGSYAFRNAFNDCASLTTAPDLSSVTSLGASALNYAFQKCTSLTTPPDLSSATSLGSDSLNYAFSGCTSLTAAPDLSSVTTLGGSALQFAFENCTSLITAPNLSNVTSLGTGALGYAFTGCSKLQTVYAPNVSSWNISMFNYWVSDAGSSAATPKQMIFQTQALLDDCPEGTSGYGNYTKVLAS